MSEPDTSMLNTSPTGKANSTEPNSPWLRPSWFWIVGIRLAQEEKHNPCRKKNVPTVKRIALRGEGNTKSFVNITCKKFWLIILWLIIQGHDGTTDSENVNGKLRA